MALSLPDIGRGWILPATRKARSLLRHQAFDAVITSGPPHSAHLVGALATVGHNCVWRADMRDPWAFFRRNYDAPGVWVLIPWLEVLVFRRVDGIITNTAEFKGVVENDYPEADVSFIPNGIDRDRLPPPPASKLNGLSIVHAGSLYWNRNLSPILLALRGFLTEHPEARETVRFRVAGALDPAHEAKLRQEVKENDLHEVVEVLGALPPQEAMNLVNRSHLALVLAQSQPLQVPAKLYECVGMGIPTLVITERSSAAAGEGRRTGAMVCESDDIPGIQRVMEDLWRDPPSANQTPHTDISYESIAAEVDALLRKDIAIKRPSSIPTEPIIAEAGS